MGDPSQPRQNPAIEKLGKKTLDELTPEEYETVRQLLVNQKLMGMSLNSGGHLTHGYRHNISSKIIKAVLYDVDPQTELLDYAALAKQAETRKTDDFNGGLFGLSPPHEFCENAGDRRLGRSGPLCRYGPFCGLVAGGVFTGEFNPIPYAHIVTSTTHKTLRGPRGGFILCKEEFRESVNKGCPVVLGGPLPHVMAAKAVGIQRGQFAFF